MPAGFPKIYRDALHLSSLFPSAINRSVWPSENDGGQTKAGRRAEKAAPSRGAADDASPSPTNEKTSTGTEAERPEVISRPSSAPASAPTHVDLFTARPPPPLTGWRSIFRSPPSPQESSADLARRAQKSLSAETLLRKRALAGTQRTKSLLNGAGAACLIGAIVALPLLAGTAGAALPLVFIGLLAGSLTSFGFALRLSSKIAQQTEDYEFARDALAAAEQEMADSLLAKLDIRPGSPSEPKTGEPKCSPPVSYQVAWQTHLSQPTARSRQLLVDVTRRMEKNPLPPAHTSSWASSLVGAAIGSNRLGLSRLGEHTLTAGAMTAVLAPQMLQVFLFAYLAFCFGFHNKLFKE